MDLRVGALAAILFTISVHAEPRALDEIFERVFDSPAYEAGHADANIQRLIAHADRSGVSLVGANVLVIENEGADWFGMAHVLAARGSGERNFFHHTVLEHTGVIYDFEFTDRPTVLPAKEYFARMFGPSADHYRVEVIAVDARFVRRAGRPRGIVLSVQSYLKSI